MAAEKIDMSLDEIIKLNRGTGRGAAGRGRGVGRGSQRGAANAGGRGASASAGFHGVRDEHRFNTRGRGSNFGGVIRGGVQKSRSGFRQQTFTKTQAEGVWQHDLYQHRAGGLQRSAATGDASARIGKLLISNLDFGVNDADMQELFAEFGILQKAAVHYDRSGRSLCTAEVTYSMKHEAVLAMNHYNNVPLDGRPMKIQLVGGSEVPVASRITPPARGVPRGTGTRGISRRGRGFGGRDHGVGGQSMRTHFGGGDRGVRGQGRGGRGRGRGAGKVPTKDELDAQLDAYTAKIDTE